ncbi:MAG: superoxide dismutase [Saprospiraceae bacterium]|nr:superoxide dismutase [Saprospiraceae bacterium]
MMVQSQSSSVFTLPELGYEFSALEPYIDTETMKIHYSKHHKAYVDKLNTSLENHKLKGKSLETILEMVMENDEDMSVLNNAGGHYNHNMFWKILTPGGGTQPSGSLEDAIIKKFGSFDEFSTKFVKAATGVFGSGWAWLSVDKNNELFISTTKNQDNPLMKNVVKMTGTPILCIDVWEHAYYLKYQNKRADYIANFKQAINWDVVSKNYESIK